MLIKQASPGLLTLNPFFPLLPLSGTSLQNWKWVLDINVHVFTKFSQQVIQKKHCSLNDLQRNGWPRDIPINIWREICKASQVPRCVSRATHSIPRVHRKPTLHHGVKGKKEPQAGSSTHPHSHSSLLKLSGQAVLPKGKGICSSTRLAAKAKVRVQLLKLFGDFHSFQRDSREIPST